MSNIIRYDGHPFYTLIQNNKKMGDTNFFSRHNRIHLNLLTKITKLSF